MRVQHIYISTHVHNNRESWCLTVLLPASLTLPSRPGARYKRHHQGLGKHLWLSLHRAVAWGILTCWHFSLLILDSWLFYPRPVSEVTADTGCAHLTLELTRTTFVPSLLSRPGKLPLAHPLQDYVNAFKRDPSDAKQSVPPVSLCGPSAAKPSFRQYLYEALQPRNCLFHPHLFGTSGCDTPLCITRVPKGDSGCEPFGSPSSPLCAHVTNLPLGWHEPTLQWRTCMYLRARKRYMVTLYSSSDVDRGAAEPKEERTDRQGR